MIRSSLKKAFKYQESLARAIFESSALYFGSTLLGKKNGDVPARVVFVSDVPEVHGAAVTGVAFCDNAMLGAATPATRNQELEEEDEEATDGQTNPDDHEPSVTARRFWEFAKPFKFDTPTPKRGWAGQKVYFAYLLARHPSTPERGHRTPSATEIKIGLQLLKAQLELARPRIIVPLGSGALKAVEKTLHLRNPVLIAKPATANPAWGPVTIFALAHPRPQERLHRPDFTQKSDWKKLAKFASALALEKPAKPTKPVARIKKRGRA
jgi:uracil-DNA glycosylase